MATWHDLAGYLRSSYKVAEDKGDLLKLLFNLDGERSQVVIVARSSMGSSRQDWATIASFFANANGSATQSILKEASEYVVGGVVQYGNELAYRHAVPLATLDIDEFLEPFELVMNTADQLEKKFVGSDNF